MTELLFRADPYLTEAEGRATHVDGGLRLDRSIFYPTGGGQAGDRGRLSWDGGETPVATTIKAGTDVVVVPEDGAPLPQAGAVVRQHLDWTARHRMMRLHTALHLLSVVIPRRVTGGQITPEKARLDFDMPDAPDDKAAIETALNALITSDHAVSETSITDEELAANPGLVKTMSVHPPTGAGHVRLVQIGPTDAPVDLQPCGGTHVRSTAEIGPISLGKIEKKGRQNRRVTVLLRG
ncbi:MAG: alanyl-tRNA editing protein [Pseudomonadota bacterium]